MKRLDREDIETIAFEASRSPAIPQSVRNLAALLMDNAQLYADAHGPRGPEVERFFGSASNYIHHLENERERTLAINRNYLRALKRLVALTSVDTDPPNDDWLDIALAEAQELIAEARE